mgnify:CR=1 FL=1
MNPFRKIVRREVKESSRTTVHRDGGFTWTATEVSRLFLECGHVRTHRGDSNSTPRKRVRCAECGVASAVAK